MLLWDDDGLPRALVEAKKDSLRATKGENRPHYMQDALEKCMGPASKCTIANGL